MNLAERTYLDHAATSPMRPEAREAMIEGMLHWANASSPHAEGRAARAALEDARARIKAALGWEHTLIFTSGASEALSLALQRVRGGRRWISAVEHDAVFRAAPDAGILPVDVAGDVDEQAVAEVLAGGGTPVVAIQRVNPETGKVQPIERFDHAIREGGGILVSDCVQWGGRIFLPQADMIVISAHKIGGPPGIGALLVRDLGQLEPTGGQEYGYRGGTENLPAALGFAAAIEALMAPAEPDLALHDADFQMRRRICDAGGIAVGGHGDFAGHILAVAMPGLSAAAQLMRFDMKGFAVSAGSACSSGTLKESRVLKAFGVAPEMASHTIRVSTGWSTTPDELRRFADAWEMISAEAGSRAA
ncbi:aminotransferase class V-fold PLP-dependent enzyme [Sphingomonas sp. HF-S3]|uniref:Cysteine desulfurase n=1 Tax=Sphingomonas rustica TaxID=3103142 RepID=A0ABV0BDY2_9SPHN